MAYHWFMTVEAESKEAAESFRTTFDTTPIELNGLLIGFSVEAERKDDLWWGVVVFPFFVPSDAATYPRGVAPCGGTESVEHAKLLTGIGNVLFDRLLRAPPFQIAILGVECESFFAFGEHDDLVQDLQEGWRNCDGLVISASLWETAGKPDGLVQRSDGTYWIPWQGETFKEIET